MAKLLRIVGSCAISAMTLFFCAAQTPPVASSSAELFDDSAFTAFCDRIGDSVNSFGITLKFFLDSFLIHL